MLRLSQKLVLASALAGTMLVSACAPSSKNTPGVESESSVNVAALRADSSLTSEQKAERMAEAAERLLTPTSFMYSHDVAELALSFDPTNRKARLLKAFLAPTMELQGLYGRIEPLMKTQPDQYVEYAKGVAQLRRMNPESSLTRFILDGPADIATEREFQEVVARFTNKLNEFRLVLKELKSGPEISLYINDEAFKKASLEEAIKECWINQPQPMVFDFSKCKLSKIYERRMNRADLEAVQQMVGGYQVYFTLINGYDLSGVYSKSDRMGHDGEANLELLLEDRNFATLRSEHGFGVIPELASDALLGVKYAISMQAKLCKEGRPSKKNRPGYLMNEGFCIRLDNEMNDTLSKVEQMLQGPLDIVLNAGGNSVTSRIHPTAFLAQPIQDARSLMPYTKNACGHVTSIADASLGGLFPNKDVNTLLALGAQSCHKPY